MSVDFSIPVDLEKIKAKLARLKIKKIEISGHEGLLAKIKAEYAELEAEIVAEYDNAGITSVADNETTYFRRTDTYYSIKDKPKVFDWLKDRGLDSLIQETVNTRTLGAEIKRLAKEEDFINPEIVGCEIVERIGFKKR